MRRNNEITREKILEYKRDICVFLEEQYILENGKPIVLEEFQKKILRDIFQTKESNGLRKYNLALLGLPKKNGKSSLASGVALYMLFADVPNAEVYSVAGDKDQAKIIFRMTAKAIERNQLLFDSVKIQKDEIIVNDTNSVYKVLSADAPTAHGLNPSCVILDEAWNQSSRELYDALTQSPARKEPLTFIVTYAGTDPTSLLYGLYRTGMQGSDPRMYFFWSEKNLASWINEEYLEQQRRRLPAAVYQRLHENKWVQGENAFLSAAEVEACKDYALRPCLGGVAGEKYYLAVDLGLTRDRTVLTVCHKDRKSGIVYLDFIKTYQGSKKSPVLISDVEEDILWANHNFSIAKNVFDPWQMKGTAQRLSGKICVEEFTFTSNSIQKLSQNLYYLFHNGLIKIFPHQALEDELLSINAEERSYGWRIDHKSGGFSDHVVSLGMSSMYAVQDERKGIGVLIAGALSFEEFQEQEKAVRKERPSMLGDIRHASRSNEVFPTQSQIESWRNTLG